MNSKLYKRVYQLAQQLLACAENEQMDLFNQYYQTLESLCLENESDSHKNHPVQWETLADFTEDFDQAMSLYEKALSVAETRKAVDYSASITFSMASLRQTEQRFDEALKLADKAAAYAEKVNDQQLKQEIKALQKALKKK